MKRRLRDLLIVLAVGIGVSLCETPRPASPATTEVAFAPLDNGGFGLRRPCSSYHRSRRSLAIYFCNATRGVR